MASPRLVVDAPSNRAAIMINNDPGSSAANLSDPAFVDPLANFGSWKWAGHPDVDYLGIVSAPTITLNFNPNSGGWVGVDYSETAGVKYYSSYRKTILTHGLGYTPVVIARINGAGYVIPLQGTFWIPINVSLNGSSGTATASVNVYGDASSISMFVEMPYYTTDTFANIQIYLCNMGIDAGGNLIRPPLNVGFEADIAAGRVRCGRFDTSYGYFYKDDSGPLMLYRGRSADYEVGQLDSNHGIHSVGVAFNVNGYTVFSGASSPITDQGTGRAWPGNDRTAAQIVKFSAAMPSLAQALDASSGRIRFGNVLDTDRSMFLISNAIVNKSFTIPSKDRSSQQPVIENLTYDLGAVHPNATDVLGLYQANGETRSIGGTSVLVRGSTSMFPDRYTTYTNTARSASQLSAMVISISAGRLIASIKRRFPTDGIGTSAKAFNEMTVNVTAFVGAFY
jgi:HAMP domain-containing protein